MKVRSDVFLDALYAVFIALILVIKTDAQDVNMNKEIIEIFRAIATCSIIYLWIRVLTKNFNEDLFIKTGLGKKHPVIDLAITIKELASIKVAVLILGYGLIRIGNFEIKELFMRMLELLLSVAYVCTLYISTYHLSKKANYEWLLATVIILPFVLLFSAYYLFIIPQIVYSIVVPLNAYWLFESNTTLINFLTFALSTSLLLLIFIFQLNRLRKTPKKINLPFTKIN